MSPSLSCKALKRARFMLLFSSSRTDILASCSISCIRTACFLCKELFEKLQYSASFWARPLFPHQFFSFAPDEASLVHILSLFWIWKGQCSSMDWLRFEDHQVEEGASNQDKSDEDSQVLAEPITRSQVKRMQKSKRGLVIHTYHEGTSNQVTIQARKSGQ